MSSTVAPKDWPKDITKQDVQRYLYDYYMSQERPQTQPLLSSQNRCNTSQSTYTLSLFQSVVSTVMKGFASTETTNRGMLVLGSTGSGKTTCATAVMDAFWDTTKTIVFATSVDASNSNPPSNFHKEAQRFFPRFKGKSMEQIKSEFEKRKVKFFTFATLAHYLMIANPLKSVKTESNTNKHKNFLQDAVLIIDEVHNIFKPLPNQRLENDALKRFLMDYNNPYTSNLKIVILTATPGDTPQDVVSLLNMIRDKNSSEITVPNVRNYADMELFKEKIRGLISYFDMSKDYSRFPKVIKESPIKLHMKNKQYIRYAEEYNKEPGTFKDMDTLLKENQQGRYFKHARRYSNMLYDLDQDMMVDEFSVKLPALIEKIKEYPQEKHYIYSAFYENRGYGGHGILAVAKTLESQLGFEKLSVKDAQRIQSQGFEGISPKPRYVIAISSELTESKEKLKALLSAFNRPENAHGEYIQVFLATQGYNEAIDLKAVRHIHIFEPLLTFAADKQTLGRAARFCSHSDLNRERGEWTVRVHRYISEEPYDLSMFNLNYLRDRAQYLQEEIQKLEEKVPILKGKLYSRLKEKKETELKNYKQMLKDIEKKYKEVEKLNLTNLEMIDDKVTKEASERAYGMMAIYQAMRTSAVDYLLFKDFHES
jgi:superfamily II DNA or RNA helicase